MTPEQENSLSLLRSRVEGMMSQKRFYHTAMVEQMVARLAELFCPEETYLLRGAALLHDITKEKTPAEQVELSRKYGIPVTAENLCAPKTFHARTAAAAIPELFPEWNHPTVVNAVLWHTTGHRGMTLTEKLLYLADYIDESRKFENCVLLRRYFFGATPEKTDAAGRLDLLEHTLLLSYDMTVRDLLSEGLPIAIDTMEARNELVVSLAQKSNR